MKKLKKFAYQTLRICDDNFRFSFAKRLTVNNGFSNINYTRRNYRYKQAKIATTMYRQTNENCRRGMVAHL